MEGQEQMSSTMSGTCARNTMTLSIVVPSYNSQDYLDRCIDSMLPLPQGVEVIIVNDGSSDNTAAIADRYAARFPDRIRVIHKANGGHGSAINAGLGWARGRYFKVCDSDDRFDPGAYYSLIQQLERWIEQDNLPDLVVTNYVYDKQGKKRKHVISYRNIFADGHIHTWSDVKRFKRHQYLLMHSLCYRTDILHEVELQLPEHCFYVDNLYAFVPMVAVRTIGYLDLNLYLYYIGREDQSVAEKVMISRLDQQLRVNRLMIHHMPSMSVDLPKRLRWYMEHYLGVVCVVSSILMLKEGSGERLAQRRALWRELRTANRHAYRHIRSTLMGALINLKGGGGRRICLTIYRLAQKIIGFN